MDSNEKWASYSTLMSQFELMCNRYEERDCGDTMT
jgi:hypothetical protein